MVDYKSTTKEGKCVFCEIISRRMSIPGIFWEDEEFMAFLTTWPNTEGFTVVVPKEHYGSDVFAMPDEVLKRFVIAAKKVSQILTRYFDDVGRVGLMMEGTGIDHAHIKLFPMHGTKHMKEGKWKQYLSDDEIYFENYEGYISSKDGPKADEEEIRKLSRALKKISEK